MKTLLLMRHAKATDEAQTDHERPLSTKGLKTAWNMGKLLETENLSPHLIMSSSAVRARDTALAVAAACDWRPEVRIMRALYMAEPPGILAQAARAPAEIDRLMIVGHNPAMEDLVSELAGSEEHLATSAIARFDVRSWPELASHPKLELLRVWRAKEIDG